ncbi:MAG: RNA-binding S4 domain-containing protein [Armatimonadota bacterium]
MREVSIRTPYITLGQFLKWAGFSDTGGDARSLIASGVVLVNGEVEQRRGRKLRPGDTVRVGGQEAVVRAGQQTG